MSLPQKILAIHHGLDAAAIGHAFGGALALAWCTQQARGTIDIDCNVFVAPALAATVVAALPEGVAHDDDDLRAVDRDGQVRLWWDRTPIDLFFNTTRFHEDMATRARRERFLDEDVPFLGCTDLAVCKAFFDRTKDWADLEAMAEAGTLDVARVAAVLLDLLGPDDDRLRRLLALG
jgi:alpha-beta hydrolase superfamily lysophospholipase